MPSGALIGAAVAGPVLGGLIGMQQSAANRAAAQAASQAALADIQAIGAPPDQQAAIILQHFQQAGLYQPGMEQQISAGISQASQTATNTQGRQAQVSALGQLQQRAGTGYSATDRAALNQIMQQTGAAEQGQLGSIQQGMQSRGVAGGGAELAQQLAAAQQSGNQAANNSLQVAANGQQAALQAAVQSGQLGGQLNASDFGEAQAKAKAADQFKLFDTQNQVAQQQRNVAAANQGQLYNLSNAQQIQNANTQQANAEQARQLAAQETQWGQQNMLGQEQANAQLGQASNLMQQAGQTAGQYAGIGAGLGAGAGAGLNYYANQGSSSPSQSVNATASGSPTGYQQQAYNNTPSYDTGDYSGMSGNSQTGGDSLSGVQYAADGGFIDPHAKSATFGRPTSFGGGMNTFGSAGTDDDSSPYSSLVKAATGGVINNADQLMGANLAHGGMSPIQVLMNHAGKVPGKAKVPGDSYANDLVDAKLSPGEIIIPRSVAEKGPDAAYGFVHAIMKAHKDNK